MFDSYRAAAIPLDWTLNAEPCATIEAWIVYFAYSLELVRAVAPHVCALKLGSGELT